MGDFIVDDGEIVKVWGTCNLYDYINDIVDSFEVNVHDIWELCPLNKNKILFFKEGIYENVDGRSRNNV